MNIKPIETEKEIAILLNILKNRLKDKNIDNNTHNIAAVWYFLLIKKWIKKDAIERKGEFPNLERYLQIHAIIDNIDEKEYRDFVKEVNEMINMGNFNDRHMYEKMTYGEAIKNFTLKKENYLLELKILETLVTKSFKKKQ